MQYRLDAALPFNLVFQLARHHHRDELDLHIVDLPSAALVSLLPKDFQVHTVPDQLDPLLRRPLTLLCFHVPVNYSFLLLPEALPPNHMALGFNDLVIH